MSSPGHAALRRAGLRLLIAVSALLVFGFLGIVSGELLDWDNSPTFRSGAFKRLAFIAAGIASGLAFTAFPIQKLRRAVPWFYAGSCILLVCCFIPSLGVEIGGAHRWIRIPGVGMRLQPSELAKPAVVLALASLLSSSWFQSRRFVHTTLIPALLVLPPILLVALEVDLGYTTLLVGAVLTLMFLRGVPLRHLWIQSAVALSAVALGTWSVPNRRSRIEVFLDLDRLASTSGYQQWRSVEALKRASALPTGAGSPGIPSADHLPFAGTDFVLPALGETWGIVVCLLVFLSYLVAMRAGFSIARFASDGFSRLAASGLLLIVLLQAIINVAVGLALLPVSGMPLPLVSAGGSNLVATSIIMGILWRIRREALRSHSLEGIETPPVVSDEVIRLPGPSGANPRVPDGGEAECDPIADPPAVAEEVYVLSVPPNHEPSGRRNRRPP